MIQDKKASYPALDNQNLSRRGIFSKSILRADLERVIAGYTQHYYRLLDGSGQMHFMVDAGVLVDLIDWLLRRPRLACKVTFVPPRKPLVTGARSSIAALRDADILSIAKLHFLEGAMFLHLYDKTELRGVYRARAAGAPMRDVDFGAMTEPYRGYRIGKPACVMSKTPIRPPKAGALVDGKAPPAWSGPVDIVYTWVDSDDPAWQERFAKFVGRPTKSSAASELRYLSRDELRYSLRSVLKYAPWVRNIFIVTDDQRPEWLRDTERVKLIDHREIFPDPSVLPTFNSHAIESCLHRIPGLSEHFIYFNDDVFLGRPVTPSDFFGKYGEAKLHFSGRLTFNPSFVARGTLPTDAAFRNTIRIVEERFDMTPIAKVLHTPHSMRKSVLEMIEGEHPKEIAATRAARTRSETDLNTTGNLAYYYCLGLGLGTWPDQGAGTYRYIDTGVVAQMKTLPSLLRRRPKFLCLNLTHHHEVPLKRQAQMLAVLFRLVYPRRAGHEIPAFLSGLRRRFLTSTR